MFSTSELDYLKGLINVYLKKGYNYYLARTVTDTNNDFDIYLYLSKDKIICSNSSTFILPEGTMFIKIDSSSRSDGYYSSLGSRDVLSFYEGTVNIDVAEFIYTNADVNYNLITDVINPDLLLTGETTTSNLYVDYCILFICVSIFLFMFLKSILRLRR